MSQNIPPLRGLSVALQQQLPEFRIQDTTEENKSIGVLRDVGLGRLKWIASIRVDNDTLKICSEEGDVKAVSRFLKTQNLESLVNKVRQSCKKIDRQGRWEKREPLYVSTSEVCGLLPPLPEKDSEIKDPLSLSNIEVSASTSAATPLPIKEAIDLSFASVLQKQLTEFRIQDRGTSLGVFKPVGLERLEFIASIHIDGQILKICSEKGEVEAVSDIRDIAHQVRQSCEAIRKRQADPLYVRTSEVCGLLPVEEEDMAANPFSLSFSIEVSQSTSASPPPQLDATVKGG